MATLESHFLGYSNNDLRKDAYFLYGPQKTWDGQPLIDTEINQVWDFNPQIPALIIRYNDYTEQQFRHSGVRIQKYEITENTKQSMANDFVLFRLTDAYLMLAECYAMEGNSAKVQQYLEPIRTRAGLSAAANYDLNAVKAERKLEMFYEGTRRQDMIRWSIFNQPWVAPWASDIETDDNNVFPIPQNAIDNNSNLLLPAID